MSKKDKGRKSPTVNIGPWMKFSPEEITRGDQIKSLLQDVLEPSAEAIELTKAFGHLLYNLTFTDDEIRDRLEVFDGNHEVVTYKELCENIQFRRVELTDRLSGEKKQREEVSTARGINHTMHKKIKDYKGSDEQLQCYFSSVEAMLVGFYDMSPPLAALESVKELAKLMLKNADDQTTVGDVCDYIASRNSAVPETKKKTFQQIKSKMSLQTVNNAVELVDSVYSIKTWKPKKVKDVDKSLSFGERFLTEGRVLDGVNDIISKIKPVNLACFIIDCITADCAATVIAAIARMLETYGLLWKGLNQISNDVINCLQNGMMFMSNQYSEVKGFMGGIDDSMFSKFMHHADKDYEAMFKMLGSDDPTVNESLYQIGPIAKVIVPLSFIGLSAIGMYKPAAVVTNAVKSMASLCKDSKTLVSTFDGLKKAVDFGFEAAFKNEKLHLFDEIATELAALIKTLGAHKVILQNDEGQVLTNVEKKNDIVKDCDRVLELSRLTIMIKDEKTGNINPLMVSALKLESEIRSLIGVIENTSSWKQEPVCIWLYGDPGVGKSTMCHYLIRLLSSLEGRDLTSYTRNSSEQYASGYRGQDVYIYDDFGMAVEGADIAEFIAIKTPTANILNMAAVEDKGKKFTSRYIIVCANICGIQSTDKIVTPAASDRRRDFLLHVVDRIATNNLINNRPNDHRMPDFSHLLIGRLNPTRNNQGSYPIIGRMTPSDLAVAAYTLQRKYEQDHRARLESVIDIPSIDELDDDNPIYANMTAEALATALGDSRPADITRHRQREAPPQQPQRGRPRDRVVTDYAQNLLWENHALSAGGEQLAIMLIGTAGTGKTFATKWLKEEATKQNIKIEVYDEFQTDKDLKKKALDHVWAYHDNKSDVIPVLVCNELQHRLTDGRDKDSLMRRVICYEFSLNVTAKIAKSLGQEVKLPEGVKIVRKTCAANAKTTRRIVDYAVLVDDILKGEVTEAKAVALELPDWVLDKPSLSVYIHKKLDELTEVTLTDFITGKIPATIKGEKLSLAMKIKLYNLTKSFSDKLGQDPKRTMLNVNMRSINANIKIDILFCLKDSAFVLSTTTGKIVFHTFHVSNPMIATSTYQAAFDEEQSEQQENLDKFSLVMEFVEGLYFLVKLGGVLTAVVFSGMDRMETHKIIKSAKEKVMQSEGKTWGEQMDEIEGEVDPHRLVREDPAYIPKNMRAKSGLEDSDPSVKTSLNRTHYVSESNERLAPPKKPEEKKGTMSELNAEAKALLRRTLAQQPKKGQPMIESSDKSKEPVRIPSTVNIELDKLPTLSRIPTHLNDSQLSAESVKEVFEKHADLKPFVHEAMKDTQAFSLLPLLRKNTLYLGTEDRITLRAVMIHGNIGVTNAHAISGWKVGDIFNCFEMVENSPVKYVGEVLQLNTKMDSCIFKLRDGRQFTSLLKHIPKKTDNANYDNMFGWLLYNFPDNSQVLTNVVVQTIASKMVDGHVKFGLLYGGHASGLSYGPVNSAPGLCGSAVIVTNPRIPRKIVAIHGAATMTEGLGVLLYQEMFEDFVAHSADHGITVLKHQCVQPVKPMRIGENFVIVGVPHDGEKILQQHHPSKTKLYKSPLALDEDSPFEPAILSKFDDRPMRDVDVFVEGVLKYDKRQCNLDQKELSIVVEEIADFYAAIIHQSGIRLKVLTKTEALNGVSYISQSNPLTRDTSSGYPWKHFTPSAKKDDFLVFNPDLKHWEISKNQYGQTLHHGIDGLIQAARRGERTAVVNVATLKDEPRKLKRIYETPETRVFWAAPLDKVIADRMYFHAAAAAIAATHEKHPIKIGINPQALGFHRLYQWLSNKSEYGFDLDTKNWDSTVPVCVMEQLYRVWNRIYEINDPNCTEEHQQIRKALHAHLVKPLVLLYDFVVQLPGGNISGQTMTAIDNSIVNHIYHYYAWRQIMARHGRRRDMTLESFHTHVASAFYGDDAVNAVDYHYVKLFSPQAYVEECAKFGVKCTPADKTTEPRVKHILELEFLKRNFVRATLPNGDPGPFFCGALQMDSFRKMLDYTVCSRGHDFWKERNVIKFDPETLGQVIACALIEATNYGRHFYDKLSQHLRERCREYGVVVTHWPSYIACYNLLWDLDLPNGNQDGQTMKSHSLKMTTQPAVAGEGGVASPQLHAAGTPVDRAEVPATRNSGMLDEFTGDYGTLPREIYEKDILIATIPWNSTQMAATPLWYQELTPQTINKYVGYFAAPYNAWAGGAVFTFSAIGTGFHGGKLLIVRFPPNYDLTTISSTQDLTVFHNESMDAKETMPIAKEIVDERNVLFHWRFETNEISRNGGTLGLFVLAPLINASNSVTSINVLVFGRPAPDFRISQLMPLPTLKEAPGYTPLFDDFFRLEGVRVTEPLTDVKITQVRVAASSQRFFTSGRMYGHVDGDGVPRHKRWKRYPRGVTHAVSVYGTSHPITTDWIDPLMQTQDDTNIVMEDYAADATAERNTGRPLTITYASQSAEDALGCQAHEVVKITNRACAAITTRSGLATTDTILDLRSQPAAGPDRRPMRNMNVGVFAQADYSTEIDVPLRWTPPVSESLVFFETTFYTCVVQTNNDPATPATTIGSSQTTHMIDTLSYVAKGVLLKGQALLFTAVDKDTNLPVEIFKLYHSGFVTASLSANNIIYKAENLRVTPYEMVPETTPIPMRPDMVMNRLLVQSRDRTDIQKARDDAVYARVMERLNLAQEERELSSRPSSSRSRHRDHPSGTLPGAEE